MTQTNPPRTVVVTGGTSGIGAAIARAFVAQGHRVAATYIGDPVPAETFSRDSDVAVYACDATDYDACTEALTKVEQDLGPVDVLINNAGITRDTPFHKMLPEQWHSVIDTNLTGMFNMTHPVWPGMRSRGFGRVVCISSVNALRGQFGQVNYSAAKAGVLGFVKALAHEGARTGVTANAICPGYIDTDMVRAIPDHVRSSIVEQIPVGRMGQPDDIARCAVFLAGDDAGFVTGATLTATGGQYML